MTGTPRVLRRHLPGLATALRYRRAWLWPDVRAGLVLSALLVPAGMGFAQAAGLPASAGLYATVVPMLAYAVFGPSRILVVGPDSALAPLIAAAVLPLAGGTDGKALALAGLLAMMVGVVLLLAGVLRLGFIADLVSKPIRRGFLNGIALIVVVSQLPALLGISIDPSRPIASLVELVGAVGAGEAQPLALALGAGSLAVILLTQWLGRGRIPGILIAVIGAGLLTWVFGWGDEVPTVGTLPAGLPFSGFGDVAWSDVAGLALPALGIALIAFTNTSVVSRTLSSRRGETVSGSREMRGLGVANLATGLFGGFPVAGSASRTPVVAEAGGRTQLAGVVGAVVVLGLILLAPSATSVLPTAALGAVVIAAVSSFVDPVRPSEWRISRWDVTLHLAAFLGVFLAGVLPGILVAIGLSFIAFVWQAWRPYRAELGRIPEVRGYHDRSRNPEAERVPGVVIVRWDAPLFFANGSIFDAWVRGVVRRAASEATATPIRTVIVAAEPMTDIDTTAMDELVNLDDYLSEQGIRLLLAELKGPVRDTLRRHGLGDRFGDDRFPPTVGAAVDSVTGGVREDLPSDAASGEGPADPRDSRGTDA